ncbi:MAG: ketoacyl-ACP synthase III [Planctomycetes bacterium]|nr:ketoacyl-ACP synthase III [Planctomycetota bacterium]
MSRRAANIGVGAALPKEVVTTEDINRRIFDTTGFEIHNGLLERITGVKTRYHRSADQQSSDLAVEAATKALERAGKSVADIDLLIFAACTQDISEPATANIVQEKLGATGAQVLDVKNACNSFLNGLDVADSHLRLGKARCALVATGETLSVGIDWNIRSAEDLKSRFAALTLGDAGAAAVLELASPQEERGILATRFLSDGTRWRMATVLAGGSLHHCDERYSTFVTDPGQLRAAAYELIPGIVAEVLDSVGWKPEDVDLACGHQVTEELVYGLSERCGVPQDRNVVTITDCGNTAAASIPLAMARAYDQGRIKRGTKILLVGGAAGFSVGVIPIIW